MPSFTSWLVRLYIRWIRRSKDTYDSPEKTLRMVQDLYLRPQSFLPSQNLGTDIAIDRVDVHDWPLYRVSSQRPGSPVQDGVARPAMLYIHGGAFFREIDPADYRFAAQVARETGLDVLVAIYPLIPRPAATAKLLAAGLIDICRRYEHPVVCIGGESAGGMLSIATAQQMREAQPELLARLRCLVLISPVLDCALDHPEVVRLAEYDPWLGLDGLRAVTPKLAAGLPLKHPVVSPLFGDIECLPPVMLLCGTADMLCADARRLKSRFQGGDGDKAPPGSVELEGFTYIEKEDMIHVYPMLPHPEGAEARKQITGFMRRHIASDAHSSRVY